VGLALFEAGVVVRARPHTRAPSCTSEDQHGHVVEDDEDTWFTVDQPSTRFGSFNTPQNTKVGLELDRKLTALLERLGAPVPTAFTDH
jgi:hypothetical protein